MPTIDINLLTVAKADLETAPEGDRMAFIVAGQVANEVNILQKQLFFFINSTVGTAYPHTLPMNAASLLMVRLLAGKMNEAKEWLGHRSMHSSCARLKGATDQEPYQALKSFRRYFNKKLNLLTMVRNQLSYHVDYKLALSGYAALEDDHKADELLAEAGGNTFYATSEMAMIEAMKRLAGENDLQKAIERYADETLAVTGQLAKVLHGIIGEFLKCYVIGGTLPPALQLLSVDAPAIASVRVPFFCSV